MDEAKWYKFTAILLSTLYAVCCKSFLALESELESEANDNLLEVSVYPDLLTDGSKREKVKGCFIDLANLLQLKGQEKHPENQFRLENFTSFVVRVCTGEVLKHWGWTYHSRVGYHANGIFIITDMVLNPSLNPTSVTRFHIGQGQPLQFPCLRWLR